MRNVLRLGLILAILLSVIPLSPVSAQDPSPWSEVFDENGNVAAIRKRCQGQLTRGPQEAATATRPRKLPLIANT